MSSDHELNRRTFVIEYDEGISARLRTSAGEPCSVEDIALIEAGIHNHYVATQPGYEEAEKPEPGYVYLMSGPDHQKIGKSRAPTSRHRNLGLLMPWNIELEHYIQTDYMSNLENYWHYRFHKKRQNGEWFKLSPQDISFFCSFSKLSLSSDDVVLAMTRLYTADFIKYLAERGEIEPKFSSLLTLKKGGPWMQSEKEMSQRNMLFSSHLSFLDGEHAEILAG